MKPESFLFVLGSEDPEMSAIRKLLIAQNLSFVDATVNGKRVHPGNAHQADPVSIPTGLQPVYVECTIREGASEESTPPGVVIDHHKAGKPGYDLPPEKFWEASSIGSVWELLRPGEIPPHEYMVLAAMDHCNIAARLGKCPGITPTEVRTLSLAFTSERLGIPVEDFEKMIGAVRKELAESPVVTMGNQQVINFTAVPTGVGFSAKYLAIQEALIDLGQAGLLCNKNTEDGPEKIFLTGAATREAAEYFMQVWAPEQGLVNIFGSPAGGYAGGFKT